MLTEKRRLESIMIIGVLKILSQTIRNNGWLLGAYIFVSRIALKAKSMIYAVALNAPSISVGKGSQIIGSRFISFGRGISIYRNLWLEAVVEYRGNRYSPAIQIGDRVGFSNGVHISAIYKISIGNDVLFGSHVFVSDHNHGDYSGDCHTSPEVAPLARPLITGGEVVIEDNVWFGDNVNVVGPVRVGYGSVIAANSVVRNDVPARSMVAGAPAKVIKKYNEITGKWERE